MKNVKDLFDIPEDVTYLNAAYMGPLLKSSTHIAQQCIQKKAQPWNFTTEDFFQPIEKARLLIGQLINSEAENIAIIPSASYGIALAAKNLENLPKGEIVVIEEQFPSNYYAWSELAKQDGHQIISISRQFSKDMTQTVLDSINDKTRIVALPYAHWCDGQKFNLQAISEKIKHHKAHLVIDGTQSVGAVPLDVKLIKPDFLITASYKWMLGPYTMGFAYIDEKFFNGRPLEHNWINKFDAENLSGLVNYTDKYQSGARRFDMGEKSQFHSMKAFVDSLEFLNEMGTENISQHCQNLVETIPQKLESIKEHIDLWPQNQRSEHILGVYFKNQNHLESAKQNLVKNKVFVSYRSKAMRISPHVYNSMDDIEKLCDILIRSIG